MKLAWFGIFLLEAVSSSEESELYCEDYFENEAFPPPGNLTAFSEAAKRPVNQSSENRYRWPWLVSLGGRCVGSLIGPRFVLTAAHCCHNPVGHEVYIGSQGPWSSDKSLRVIDFRRHEKFNIATHEYDICLLRLAQPVEISVSSYPICLVHRKSTIIKENSLGASAGWGDLSQFGTPSKKILDDPLRIQPVETCKRAFHFFDPEKTFCTGSMMRSGKRPTCVGSGGAPFVMWNKNKPTIAGLTSLGLGCDMGRPLGLQTKIQPFVGWLVNKAIDMGAQMTSGKMRSMARKINLKSASNIEESPRAQRRALKAQRRAIKMVERRKEVEKREMLADRFKERMLRRKKAFLPKDIRRFVKLSLQEKMSKKEYLKPNQIDKMRSIDAVSDEENICSPEGLSTLYSDIKAIQCGHKRGSLSCSFECLTAGYISTAKLTCKDNKWKETFTTDKKTICGSPEV